MARWRRASPTELLPLIEALNRQPIGAFQNLRDLHANCHGKDSELSSACIEVMRDLLLESVDQRLQNIYHEHFRAGPPKRDATHEQKIATLEATRDDVRLILNSYNWRWFANWLELARLGESAEICVRQLANFAFPIERVNFRYFRGKDIAGIQTFHIDTPCNAINQIVFDPDGSVRPCCGLNNENQGIVIGRAGQHRLKTLAKQMQNDPILQFLATHSMSAIFAYVGKSKEQNGYSGTCHLCQDALGGLVDKRTLQGSLFDRQNFYPFWFTLANTCEIARQAEANST